MSALVQRQGTLALEVPENGRQAAWSRVEQKVHMIRHDRIGEQEETVLRSRLPQYIQQECALVRYKMRDAFCQICSDEEEAVALFDAPQPRHGMRIVQHL